MNTKPVLLVYCQHSLGMGHLMRAFAMARALAINARVVFLNGGPFPAGMTPPKNVEIFNLPPLGMRPDSTLHSLDSRYSAEESMLVRRDLILDLFNSLDPDLLLIELFPFGRKKFAGEIEPLLEMARSKPASKRPVVVCSLRDILVGSRHDQQRHDDRAAQLANRYFDAILVHADPAFARLDESFKPQVPLTVPVHYTGFVHDTPDLAFQREPRVLVSAGSGSVGAPLFQAALAAQPTLWNQQQLSMKLIAGPFLDAGAFAELEQASENMPGLTVIRSVPNMVDEMARAAVSVSQCGYNTAMDLIASKVPAIVVPYSEGREDEQGNRARKMADLGLLSVLPSEQLSPERLSALVTLAMGRTPAANRLDMNGCAKTVQLVNSLLDKSPRRSSSLVQEAQ